MKNYFTEQLIMFLILGSMIMFSLFTMVNIHQKCETAQQDYELLQPSLAGVTVKDSIQFEREAEFITNLNIPEETPVTGDTVCAYIVDTTMYIQHYLANRVDGYQYQNKMFKFVWNN